MTTRRAGAGRRRRPHLALLETDSDQPTPTAPKISTRRGLKGWQARTGMLSAY